MSASAAASSPEVTISKQFIGLLKEGFGRYTDAVQSTMPAPVPIQQVLMPMVMGFAGGNWSFMDSVLPHVATQLTDFAATVGRGDVAAGAKAIGADVANSARDILANDAGVVATLAQQCTPGTDAVGATHYNVAVLIEQLVLLAINISSGATAAPFSDAAKGVVVTFSGCWLEQIAGTLTNGRAGIMVFLQSLSSVITPRFVALFPPEISMYAMFATPLILNMLMQFHQQYLKEQEAETAGLYA